MGWAAVDALIVQLALFRMKPILAHALNVLLVRFLLREELRLVNCALKACTQDKREQLSVWIAQPERLLHMKAWLHACLVPMARLETRRSKFTIALTFATQVKAGTVGKELLRVRNANLVLFQLRIFQSVLDAAKACTQKYME